MGLNEHCSEHFCKLHTLSIFVCNHPNRVVQIHPDFKNFLQTSCFQNFLDSLQFLLEILVGNTTSHHQQQPYCHNARYADSMLFTGASPQKSVDSFDVAKQIQIKMLFCRLNLSSNHCPFFQNIRKFILPKNAFGYFPATTSHVYGIIGILTILRKDVFSFHGIDFIWCLYVKRGCCSSRIEKSFIVQ